MNNELKKRKDYNVNQREKNKIEGNGNKTPATVIKSQDINQRIGQEKPLAKLADIIYLLEIGLLKNFSLLWQQTYYCGTHKPSRTSLPTFNRYEILANLRM